MDAPDPDGDADDARQLTIGADQAGTRLDKALAEAAVAAGLSLSRSRIAQLIASGAVTAPDGRPVAEARGKVKPGETYGLTLPPPEPATPLPQAIPLDIVHEDRDLIVVNKPVGMVVHPAPGSPDGTLVNALLHHCGPELTGIGGTARPGIVHRIDKDTSGLLVVAKTEAAHAGLSRLFASHDIHRRYLAVTWGAPDRGDPRLSGMEAISFASDGHLRIEAPIGRHKTDRKRMAVTPRDGRAAVTHLRTIERFGTATKPFAALIEAELETGRTHQIRVHAAHIGHPLVGDATYGRPRAVSPDDADAATRAALAQFPRQALHAAELGFAHPVSGAEMHFCAEIPQDMNGILTSLRRNS